MTTRRQRRLLQQAAAEPQVAAAAILATGLHRISEAALAKDGMDRKSNAMMLLIAVEAKLLRTLTMWEFEGYYYLQDRAMKKPSACSRCLTPRGQVQGVYFRQAGVTPAVYGPKSEMLCSNCRQANPGQYRSRPGTDATNNGEPTKGRGSKAAKLTRDLGGNMAASIAGPAEIAPCNPADRRYEGRSRDTGGAMIALDRIKPDPGQPRKTFDPAEIRRLGESLIAHGQLQSCVVRWDSEQQIYILIAGERRYRGAKEVSLQELRCFVWKDGMTEADIRELQLIENIHRASMPPLEEAQAFRHLMNERGWNGQQLAVNLQLHPSSVSRALSLLRLPDDVQNWVERGILTPTVASEIAKASKDQHRNLADAAVVGKLSRDQVAERVKAAKDPVDPRVTREKCTLSPTKPEPVKLEPWEWTVDDGTRIVITPGPGKSLFGLLSASKALRQALAQVEDAINADLPRGMGIQGDASAWKDTFEPMKKAG